MALHPKYINNIPLGLVNHFNKLINQWHPQLNGILAGYGRLQLRRPTGNMLNEEAHIHLDVQSEFQFDENAFLNTVSNDIMGDIIDNPNELYDSFEKTNQIKVVNINNEDKINLNESEKNTTDKNKNKNYLHNFQTHNTN